MASLTDRNVALAAERLGRPAAEFADIVEDLAQRGIQESGPVKLLIEHRRIYGAA